MEIQYEQLKTVPLSKFHPELRFEFIDLPTQLFDYALIRAARTIAKDGGVIRRRIVINPTPYVENYKLRSPDGFEVCSVLGIWYDSCCGDGQVARGFTPLPSARLCPRDYAWYDDIEEELHIVQGVCRYPCLFYVTVSVCPPDETCELPAVFYDEYVDLLLLGAKARILRLNNKPWTNLQLAALYEKGFTEGIALASVEAHTKKMRGLIKMRPGRIL